MEKHNVNVWLVNTPAALLNQRADIIQARFRMISRLSGLKFWSRSVFGIAIFTSAFLLFQVQLLLGKFLLPWFGGTSAIWATCLLFFQVLLLGGYVYARDRECISALAAGQSTSRISGDHFGLARRHLVLLELASPARPFLETGTRGGTDPGNRGIIIHQCRPAVSSSFQHRAVAAKLVCPPWS